MAGAIAVAPLGTRIEEVDQSRKFLAHLQRIIVGGVGPELLGGTLDGVAYPTGRSRYGVILIESLVVGCHHIDIEVVAQDKYPDHTDRSRSFRSDS